MLAFTSISSHFFAKNVRGAGETWYTPRSIDRGAKAELTPISAAQLAWNLADDVRLRRADSPPSEGRDPVMTRIPLNRAYEQSQDLKDKLEMSTAEIGLAVRTTNCLEERGVFTVNDLLHCTREDLLSISNFGEKTLEEVYKALEGIGFYRRGREPAHV
jgi:DNA-directed RNA polymerase subunit alpha